MYRGEKKLVSLDSKIYPGKQLLQNWNEGKGDRNMVVMFV